MIVPQSEIVANLVATAKDIRVLTEDAFAARTTAIPRRQRGLNLLLFLP